MIATAVWRHDRIVAAGDKSDQVGAIEHLGDRHRAYFVRVLAKIELFDKRLRVEYPQAVIHANDEAAFSRDRMHCIFKKTQIISWPNNVKSKFYQSFDWSVD